jgi:hypothetical protein
MIIQIDKYKFGNTEVNSFSLKEGQKIIEHERIGKKPTLENNGADLWSVSVHIRGFVPLNPDLEKKIIALLGVKRAGNPVAFAQGENNWNMCMITDFSYDIEEMDDKGRPVIINCYIELKEYVKK